jgi:phosphate transport system permease protein
MNIVTDLKYAGVGSLHETSLFTTGIVLFIFIMATSMMVQMYLKRSFEKDQ